MILQGHYWLLRGSVLPSKVTDLCHSLLTWYRGTEMGWKGIEQEWESFW